MESSIFWYDYETTGISPRCDRPLQVAGIRTNEALEEIGEPLNLFCRPSDDILPHPAACLVTGITPQVLEREGLCEAEFMHRLHQELAQPGTCGAGYNNLRFDDEMTRYSLYRNFFDPYAREWQGGNSRWDLIDLVRTAYALRPEGLQWPQDEGRVSLKLERLTAANGLEHLHAHDALSDVRATIALARLIRDAQPRLYDYLFRLRRKHAVLDQIELFKPLVHVSGRFSAQRHFMAVVLPMAWHPSNRNALIVCDLHADPSPLWDESGETLRRRLYTRREELAENELPTPLKLVHVNRCPVLAPLSVLRDIDIQRLQLDLPLYQRRAQMLCERREQWQGKFAAIYAQEGYEPVKTRSSSSTMVFSVSATVGYANRFAWQLPRNAQAANGCLMTYALASFCFGIGPATFRKVSANKNGCTGTTSAVTACCNPNSERPIRWPSLSRR